MPLDAIVVLGCRVDARGEPLPAARRRIERAARAFHETGEPYVIVSGGKRWHGRSEAQVFAATLERIGVPRERLMCEEQSHSTRENARYSARIATARGFRRLGVVSCEWHLSRARRDFARYGFAVELLPAPAPPHVARARRWTERAQTLWDGALIQLELWGLLVLLLVVAVPACQRAAPPGAEPSPSARAISESPVTPERVRALREAEFTRRAETVPQESLTSPSIELRVLAMRALSRSAEAASIDRLLTGLNDDAPAVVEFAAFGLSRVGAERALAVSRASALRAATLVTREPPPAELDAMMFAIASAMGRLANDEAERTLRHWLNFEPAIASAAALALGELAARRGRLPDETLVALLDAAERKPTPIEAALYPFSRVDLPEGALAQRLTELATRALNESSPNRADALHALERAHAVEPLARALDDAGLRHELGPELIRALSHLGNAGHAALAKQLARAPTQPQELAALLEAPEFSVWLALLDASSNESSETRGALQRLAQLEIPTTAWKARRALLLRCGAARLLAGKNWESAELRACDPNGNDRSEQLAELAVIDRDKLSGARAERLRKLAASSDAVVRQAALRLLINHAELAKPHELLITALADEAPGCVAAAAEVLAQQPERAREPAHAAVNEAVARAYRAHANAQNPAVLSALIDASAALQILSLGADLERTCSTGSATLREHADRALTSLGGKRCPAPSTPPALPAELDHLRTRPVRALFQTELGDFELELDPSDAPVAVTRIADLVKSGFYDGIEVHRSVPGFVLQFGDRGGDGYGGAGRALLRSELAPRRFEAHAVGLAESGPDTGSSQVFVTLGRFPHLDGNATYLGKVGPGWERLALYDRISKARLDE